MSKALITGNGMTSFLIPAYRDKFMIEKFIEAEPELYSKLNNDFNRFRLLKPLDSNNRREKVIAYLDCHNASELYEKYFLDYGLIYEIESENDKIVGIETLLKVSRLLNYSDSDYSKIRKTANKLYFSNGNNGVNAIENSQFDKEKAHTFLAGFTEIYTTNFDNLLDELSGMDVKHLHGGFYYHSQRQGNGEIHILKSKSLQSVEKAYLIWGVQSEEKEKQQSGGFTFPMSFKINFSGQSILQNYHQDLEKMEIDELHILGYSGQNDAHINKSIAKNTSIKRIVKYCSPYNELDNNSYQSEIESNFLNKIPVVFKSWDVAWVNMLQQ